jgi:hypothetical protein
MHAINQSNVKPLAFIFHVKLHVLTVKPRGLFYYWSWVCQRVFLGWAAVRLTVLVFLSLIPLYLHKICERV